MAVAITQFHAMRVADQVRQNIIGIQADMWSNAGAHLAMATAQSPSVPVLAQFITDCALEYLRRLQWIIDLRNDEPRRLRLVAIFEALALDETELVNLVQQLRNAAISLRDAPKGSYATITTVCTALRAEIDAPESLWPE